MEALETTESPRHGERTIRNLPVKLTPHEVAERGQRLAELVARKEATIAKRSEWVSKFNGETKEIEAEIISVASMVQTGHENREVECVFEKDLHKHLLMVRRLDTGEVIDSRRLQLHETQADLPLEDPESMRSTRAPSSPKSGGKSNAKVRAVNTPAPAPMDDEDEE